MNPERAGPARRSRAFPTAALLIVWLGMSPGMDLIPALRVPASAYMETVTRPVLSFFLL